MSVLFLTALISWRRAVCSVVVWRGFSASAVRWRASTITGSCCVTLWTVTGWIWSRSRRVTVCWRRGSRGWRDSSRTSARLDLTASAANGYQTFTPDMISGFQSMGRDSRLCVCVFRCFFWAVAFIPVRRRLVSSLTASWTSSWVRTILALRRSAGCSSSNSFPCWTPTGSSGVTTGQRSPGSSLSLLFIEH